jgi:hypothetical protein
MLCHYAKFHYTESLVLFIIILNVIMFSTLSAVANVIQLFAAVIYDFSQKARAFVSDKPFQPMLMFAGKAGSYPTMCSTLG